MPDLYSDLGVPKSASEDVIRSAHRKGVKKFHPDNQKTGDRDQFDKIQRAYVVLRDPVTRERYDSTGETETPRDNDLARIAQIIVSAFDKAVSAAINGSGSWKTKDLAKAMLAYIREDKATLEKRIAETKDGLDAIEDIRKRLNYSGEADDLIGSALDGRIRDTRLGLERMAKDREFLERATVYAKDYGYAFEAPERSSDEAFLEAMIRLQQERASSQFYRGGL